MAIAPVIETSATKKLIRKNNTIFVALAIALVIETSTTNLKTNTQEQHYFCCFDDRPRYRNFSNKETNTQRQHYL